MLDANSILILMVVSGAAGFITKIIFEGLGKTLAILGAFPFILFLIGAADSGMKLDNPSEVNLWVAAFVENIIPLLLSFFAEGIGAGLGRKVKGFLRDD